MSYSGFPGLPQLPLVEFEKNPWIIVLPRSCQVTVSHDKDRAYVFITVVHVHNSFIYGILLISICVANYYIAISKLTIKSEKEFPPKPTICVMWWNSGKLLKLGTEYWPCRWKYTILISWTSGSVRMTLSIIRCSWNADSRPVPVEVIFFLNHVIFLVNFVDIYTNTEIRNTATRRI